MKLPGLVHVSSVKKCSVFLTLFVCLKDVDPLIITQLCVYHDGDVFKDHTLGVCSIKSGERGSGRTKKMEYLSKKPNTIQLGKIDFFEQVTIGNKQQPICIPRNLVITIPKHTNRLLYQTVCLIQQTKHHNLLLGIVVNQCVAIPESMAVPIISVKTNKFSARV